MSPDEIRDECSRCVSSVWLFQWCAFAFGCVYDLVLQDWVVTIVIFKSKLFFRGGGWKFTRVAVGDGFARRLGNAVKSIMG